MAINHPKGLKTELPEPHKMRLFRPTTSIVNVGTHYSYKPMFGPVFDQGTNSDCVANAVAGMGSAYKHKRQGLWETFSRRAIYAQGKADNPSTEDMADDGMYITDGLNVLKQHGYITEAAFPNDGTPFIQVPPSNLWQTDFEIKAFNEVPTNVDSMKLALHQHGPLIVGLNWPQEWEYGIGPDGIAPPPVTPNGGHCVLIVGWDNAKGFEVRNSWGNTWGNAGYCWINFNYQSSPSWFSNAYSIAA